MTVAVKRQMHQNFLPCNTVCWCWNSVLESFFFYQGFLSQALTIHRAAGEGKGSFFIPLYYHFHALTNIRLLYWHLFATFICNFACEMTITYFQSQRLCLPDDCYSMRVTTLSYYHLIDWLMMQCLFVYLMNWF